MNDTFEKDFATLRRLLDSRAGGGSEVRSHPNLDISGAFEFDLRHRYEPDSNQPTRKPSIIQSEYIHIEHPKAVEMSIQTDSLPIETHSQCANRSDCSKLIHGLETTVHELQAANRRACETLNLCISLMSRTVFCRRLRIAANPQALPDNKFLVMIPEEWFLYDNFAADVDPLMCISTKYISITLDPNQLTAKIEEASIPKWVVYFKADRDIFKVFLAAISYTNIPVNISEHCEVINPDHLAVRE